MGSCVESSEKFLLGQFTLGLVHLLLNSFELICETDCGFVDRLSDNGSFRWLPWKPPVKVVTARLLFAIALVHLIAGHQNN